MRKAAPFWAAFLVCVSVTWMDTHPVAGRELAVIQF